MRFSLFLGIVTAGVTYGRFIGNYVGEDLWMVLFYSAISLTSFLFYLISDKKEAKKK